MKKLIVTADDFGLSEKINEGILEAHIKGVVTASSLLIAAPATHQAIEMAKKNSKLQIGLHLGIVESFSLSKNMTLICPQNYFDSESPCLPMNWKSLLLEHYIRGKFDSQHWTNEFELQIIKFLKHFDHVPFINSTQHLHMLPMFNKMLIPLYIKYRIPYIRNGQNLIYSNRFSKRPIQTSGIILCSQMSTGNEMSLAGIDEAGKLKTKTLIQILNKIPSGTTELVVHPGYNDLNLKKRIPKTYQDFNWEGELAALCSEGFKEEVVKLQIELSQFPVLG